MASAARKERLVLTPDRGRREGCSRSHPFCSNTTGIGDPGRFVGRSRSLTYGCLEADAGGARRRTSAGARLTRRGHRRHTQEGWP